MQVDASGRIAMPLVGTVDARGKTATELAVAIEGALRGRYVRSPEVTVNIKSSVSQIVTIGGQVVEKMGGRSRQTLENFLSALIGEALDGLLHIFS